MKSSLIIILLATVWVLPARLGSEKAFLDTRDIQALIHNQRPVKRSLEYRGRRRVDTGYNREDYLRFFGAAGRLIYVRASGLEGRKFLKYGSYSLEIRFTGYTPRGIPLCQTTQPEQKGTRKVYEGDIRESDPRVEEVKQLLMQKKPAPTEIRLRYSGSRGDYLAFYDLTGRFIYFRFREDRFDDRGDRRKRDLVKGGAYLVRGDFSGLLLDRKFIKKDIDDFQKALKVRDSLLVYKYLSAKPLRLEQILF